MAELTKTLKAKYIGPEKNKSGFKKDETYEIYKNTWTGGHAGVAVQTIDTLHGKAYPSEKAFLADWEVLEVLATRMGKAPQQKGKPVHGTTKAEAGAVIYTELIDAINYCNKHAEMNIKNEFERPKYTIQLKQVDYPDAARAETGAVGAGVLFLEVEQYGLKRVVHNEGLAFKTTKELENVNAYAPDLYRQMFHRLIECALLYIQSINPDNPAVQEAMQNLQNKPDIDEKSANEGNGSSE